MSNRETVGEPTGETIQLLCTNFLQITHEGDQGEKLYLLLLNRAALFRGTFESKREPVAVYSPIGGSTEVTDEGRIILNERLPEQSIFVHGNDLRIQTSPEGIATLRQFLITTELYEQTPTREVYEELVDEFGLLNKEDVESLYNILCK